MARMRAMSSSVRRCGGQFDRGGIQREPDLEELPCLGGADRGDAGVFVVVEFDQSFAAEPADRFPQRGDAHPQLVGELVLGQPGAGRKFAGQDQSAQLVIGDVALTGEDVGDLQCRHVRPVSSGPVCEHCHQKAPCARGHHELYHQSSVTSYKLRFTRKAEHEDPLRPRGHRPHQFVDPQRLDRFQFDGLLDRRGGQRRHP